MSSIMQTLNMDSDASGGVRNWWCKILHVAAVLSGSLSWPWTEKWCSCGSCPEFFYPSVGPSGCGGVCVHVSGSVHIPTAVNRLSGVLPVREQCMGT